MKILKEKNIQGFTIIEMLIAMALTSAAIGFSYSALTYTQRLFIEFKMQNQFINDWSGLKLKIDILFSGSRIITAENQQVIFSEERRCILELDKKLPVLKISDVADTFHFQIKSPEMKFEHINNTDWNNRLLKSLRLETMFKGQKFTMDFTKNYDSVTRLQLEEK